MKTPEYRTWINIKTRCYNPNSPDYKDYGAIGIVMCDKWVNNFPAFLGDIGVRPSMKHSLDRFPNKEGNYEPGNIRWATPKEQSRNTRKNVWIEYNGEKKLMTDWSSELNVQQINLSMAVKKHGVEKAFKFYVDKKNGIRHTCIKKMPPLRTIEATLIKTLNHRC